MGKYSEKIADSSLWVTATPTLLARTLPFYITEAGHFTAEKEYLTQRESHDSFLMMYTVRGQGFLRSGDKEIQLRENDAVVIDCHAPHKYYSLSDEWEFWWVHFDGVCAMTMFNIIYPTGAICAVEVSNPYDFTHRLKELLQRSNAHNITNFTDISLRLHYIMNIICASSVLNISNSKSSDKDIEAAVEFIEENYSNQITIDDIINHIHISKYHFIRLFRLIMGITPYQYLTNYRINMSKPLLRTTSKTVAEISELCGFLDTSNYINHFKKHTGQKPLQYRRDFS